MRKLYFEFNHFLFIKNRYFALLYFKKGIKYNQLFVKESYPGLKRESNKEKI